MATKSKTGGYTDEHKAQTVKAFKASGQSFADFAPQVGISQQTLRVWVQKADGTKPKKKKRASKKAAKMRAETATPNDNPRESARRSALADLTEAKLAEVTRELEDSRAQIRALRAALREVFPEMFAPIGPF